MNLGWVQLKDQLHLSIQRRAIGIAPLMPGRCNFKRLLKFIGLKNIKKIILNRNYSCDQ